jgi:hypothetical protein
VTGVKNGIRPRSLSVGKRSSGLRHSCVQHLLPTGRIVQGYANRMLDETRDIRRLPRGYQPANLFQLLLLKSDRELLSRHTNYHTRFCFLPQRLVAVQASLLPNNLHQHPFAPPAIELAVKDLFPWAEIQPSFRDCHHYLPAHDLPFHVSVCVVFAG